MTPYVNPTPYGSLTRLLSYQGHSQRPSASSQPQALDYLHYFRDAVRRFCLFERQVTVTWTSRVGKVIAQSLETDKMRFFNLYCWVQVLLAFLHFQASALPMMKWIVLGHIEGLMVYQPPSTAVRVVQGLEM